LKRVSHGFMKEQQKLILIKRKKILRRKKTKREKKKEIDLPSKKKKKNRSSMFWKLLSPRKRFGERKKHIETERKAADTEGKSNAPTETNPDSQRSARRNTVDVVGNQSHWKEVEQDESGNVDSKGSDLSVERDPFPGVALRSESDFRIIEENNERRKDKSVVISKRKKKKKIQ